MEENRGILKVLTDVMMNERLDEILQYMEEYIVRQNEIDEATAEYNSLDLLPEEKKVVDKLVSAYNADGAFYATMAYQQGMKDCAVLLKEIGVV